MEKSGKVINENFGETTSGRPFKHSSVDTNETATYRASDLHRIRMSLGNSAIQYTSNLHSARNHRGKGGKEGDYDEYGQKTGRPTLRNDMSRTHAQ
ncbi:MAG: hypothetical protein GY820_03200 [Gammaproteobacteria bacterium]|nr:hypothetical protein [Gammaproteobacteria bacterium]